MRFEQITSPGGIQFESIPKIVQDYQGFIWFCTWNELFKYDGIKFISYRFDKNDTNISSNIDASYIYEDRSKNLWIGAPGVLFRYNREKDNFENYFLNHDNKASELVIISICEDDSSNLYLGTNMAGIYRFDTKNETFKHYKNNEDSLNKLSKSAISDLCFDKDNTIWITTYFYGLYRLDLTKQTFKNYKNIPVDKSSLSSNKILSLYMESSGTLWIGTNNGLNRFDKETESFQAYGINTDSSGILNNAEINHIAEIQKGKLWLSTSGKGLIIFNKESFLFQQIKNEPGNPFSLSNNYVNFSFKDRSGVIWLGNASAGLTKYNPESSKFVYFKTDPNDVKSLTGGKVQAIIEDSSGTIWAGTEQGLNKFDNENNTFTRYQKIPGNKNTLSDNNVYCINEDNKGIIWIGTDNGLNEFDEKRGTFSVYRHSKRDTNSLDGNQVRAIYEDSFGNLWIGTMGGVDKFLKEKKIFKHYVHENDDTAGISCSHIYCFYEDRSANFWIGTRHGGLNKFNRAEGTYKSFLYSESSVNAISNLLEDNKNRLWATSWQSGLNLFDRSKDIFIYSFDNKNGLPSNSAVSVLEDNNGNLWIGTPIGLTKYNPDSGKFKNYDISDGLPFSYMNQNAALRGRNGMMYFGGMEGYLRFHPDSLEENTNPPPVVLTDFKIFHKSVKPSDNSPLKKNINVADEIVLTYKEDIFSIEFASLDYRNPAKNKYAYMLGGINTDWVYTDASNRSAIYTHIDPGEYVFRVKGSNNDGVWNETGTAIRIIITPPWWQTLWFRTIAVLAMAGIFGSSVRYITVQRYKRRLELEKERTRISKDMHDEVGSSLTKISILSELAKQKAEDPKLKSNVEKISESANDVVNSISEIVWALNPGNDTLDNLLAYIREYASETLELKSIEYKFDMPEEVPLVALTAEVRRNVFLVIKEAINNIIKYAHATMVNIFVRFRESTLEIEIKDNGNGFVAENTRRFGNGLINMKRRIEDINGEFSLKSEIGAGTELWLKILLIR